MEDFKPEDDGRTPTAVNIARHGSALDTAMQEHAENALGVLSELCMSSCYCEDRDGELCDYCTARKADEHIQKLAYPVVRSIREDRLDYAERVFFEKWLDENTQKRGINHGCGLLELLLSDDPSKHVARVSQRDMDVATTVIQWLGTNGGRCFIESCEREWKRRNELTRGDWCKWTHNPATWSGREDKPELMQIAQHIAERWAISESSRYTLYHEIAALLILAHDNRKQLAEVAAPNS